MRWLAAAGGVVLALAGVGVAVAVSAASEPTVGTATFTNVVTFTVPTITETTPAPPPVTVTVTTTVPAPPPPPPTTTTAPPTTTSDPPPPAPANLYLAPNGSDSGSCSSTSPCRSFARAYAVAASGAVVSVGAGVYPAQNFAGGYQSSQGPGSKAITFRGVAGNAVRQLHSGSPNITYDGIHVDANRAKTSGAAFEMGGDSNVTFKNGSIGNVTDEKGALVGGNVVFDNVDFHDVYQATAGVHNECVYAMDVPGMVLRNSVFRNCATMDLMFTHRTWACPCPAGTSNVTLEGNTFWHSTNGSGWHYYGLYIGNVGGGSGDGVLTGWKIRNNWFENDVYVGPSVGSGNVFCGNTGAGAPTGWKAAC